MVASVSNTEKDKDNSSSAGTSATNTSSTTTAAQISANGSVSVISGNSGNSVPLPKYYAFELESKTDKIILTLFVKTIAEKQEWMSSLNTLILYVFVNCWGGTSYSF